jgi:hypothetical protein
LGGSSVRSGRRWYNGHGPWLVLGTGTVFAAVCAREPGMIRNTIPSLECPDCEPLPSKVAASGRLHLWFSLGHSAKKLRVYLDRGRRRAYEATEDRRVLIHVEERGWGGLLDELSALFSPAELGAITALCKAGSDESASGDFPRLRSLKQLVASGRSA